jgi:hypothetical protein
MSLCAAPQEEDSILATSTNCNTYGTLPFPFPFPFFLNIAKATNNLQSKMDKMVQ